MDADNGRSPKSSRISSTTGLSSVIESFSFSNAVFRPATLNRVAALNAGPAASRISPIKPAASGVGTRPPIDSEGRPDTTPDLPFFDPTARLGVLFGRAVLVAIDVLRVGRAIPLILP